MRLLLFLAILSCTAISGCATQQALPKIDNWDSYQQRLAQLHTWEIDGKVGVRTSTANGSKGGSAYLHWQQLPENYSIRLSGPLGQGTTWIRGDDYIVTLEQAGQPTQHASRPEGLIYQTLGWQLPISDLFYWVRGIPAPDSIISHQQRGESGTLTQLEQAGWQLNYSRYSAVGPWQLPGKIVAEHGELKLTLIINDWEL